MYFSKKISLLLLKFHWILLLVYEQVTSYYPSQLNDTYSTLIPKQIWRSTHFNFSASSGTSPLRNSKSCSVIGGSLSSKSPGGSAWQKHRNKIKYLMLISIFIHQPDVLNHGLVTIKWTSKAGLCKQMGLFLLYSSFTYSLYNYRKVSNISRTKSQNLNVSRLIIL